jgi:D-alanyl-D-alanine carboxypeptidase
MDDILFAQILIGKYSNSNGASLNLFANELANQIYYNPGSCGAVFAELVTKNKLGYAKKLASTFLGEADVSTLMMLANTSVGKGSLQTIYKTMRFADSGDISSENISKLDFAIQAAGKAAPKRSLQIVPNNSLTFPPRPDNLPAPTLAGAIKLFGSFAYVANPKILNGRGITITDGWDSRNIQKTMIPQLKDVPIYGSKGSGNLNCHKLVAKQMIKLFQAWEDEGLSHLILSFSGGFTPRFIGGTTTLSNHAFGAAFDINEAWNGQPATPAATGKKGSLRELVPIANDLGFYWGGHYKGKPDGMHFEVVVLK